MPLDKTALEKVKEKPDGSYTARCPACAGSGGDSQGGHLIVFPDGRYGCAAFQGDSDHRKQIWKLAGMKTRKSGSPNDGIYRGPVFEVKRMLMPSPRTAPAMSRGVKGG